MNLRDAARRAAALRVLHERVRAAADAARADLAAALADRWREDGVDRVQVVLDDGRQVGTVSLVKPGPSIAVDEAAFVGWVRAHHPSEVILAVREPFRRAVMDRLRVAGDEVVDTATGEPVPWAAVQPAGPPTTVRLSDLDRDAIAAAARDGRLGVTVLPELTAGGDDA